MEVSEACGIEFFPGSYSPALKDKNDEAAYPKRYSINLGLDKDPNLILDAIEKIKAELVQRREYFIREHKLLEEQRITQRTQFDIEMMNELGYCSGIENYYTLSFRQK